MQWTHTNIEFECSQEYLKEVFGNRYAEFKDLCLRVDLLPDPADDCLIYVDRLYERVRTIADLFNLPYSFTRGNCGMNLKYVKFFKGYQENRYVTDYLGNKVL